MRAAVVGLAGPSLAAEEAAVLRACPPAGIILFARNIVDPDQLQTLIAAVRRILPRNAVLMVDQEGGRVARLRPPYWRAHPPAAVLGDLCERDPEAGLRAAWLTGALIGLDCADAGFDVACAPVLDLRRPDAGDVIGDRAFSTSPMAVARLGREMAAGLLAAGVQPVGKHAPGHGRATVDSHFALPTLDATDLADDLLPFRLNADLPWVMTAHILYRGWDAERPATLSPTVIGDVIRGRLGFEGVLVTDDLAMQALSGEPCDRALAALVAGCDIALYCAGDLPRTAALLEAVPAVTAEAATRLRAARDVARGRRAVLDAHRLASDRDRLLTAAAPA